MSLFILVPVAVQLLWTPSTQFRCDPSYPDPIPELKEIRNDGWVSPQSL
jgi:hypothetical protein